jgi:hypothetical protein
MAGQYVNIIVPGYTNLYVRDLPYTPGSGDASDTNPFNPTDARPLIEGEWVERTGADKVTRGGNNAMASSGTKDNEGTKPAFLFFSEKGRYDVQLSKRAHIIAGPHGFEFRTKLCVAESSGYNVGDPVSVWDYDGDGGSYGVVRRVLGKAVSSGAYVVGYVTRVFGSADIAVMYSPGLKP